MMTPQKMTHPGMPTSEPSHSKKGLIPSPWPFGVVIMGGPLFGEMLLDCEMKGKANA